MNRETAFQLRWAPLLLAVLLLAACAPATGSVGTVAPPASTGQPSLPVPSAEPTPGMTSGPTVVPGQSPTPAPVATPNVEPSDGGGTTTVRVYFFLGSFVDNPGLVPVLREIPQTVAVGAAAMAALLEGPNDDELGARPAMYSAIPEGTRFLGLRIDDGIATVNLSKEFESGGGSASVIGRLAQVVYTLTQFPTVSAVSFELDGVPVDAFAGEGVVLDEPVDREDYLDQLPVIFVDRPAWGGVLRSQGRISGMANAFEATFQIRIADGDGRGLAQKAATATCGTGCWGMFDERIQYSVSQAGWGALQVFELSAQDGSIVNLTEYPVWLTP